MKPSLIKEIENIIKNNNLSCNINNFQDKIDCNNISANQKLSEEFMREFKDKISWYSISVYQKLSEEFMREFKDMLNWNSISKYQKLSEVFMREFKDMLNWNNISVYQKLSEEFMREFKDMLNWNSISVYQKLSEEFMREFNIKVEDDNWLYKTKEFKLNKLKELGLYEIIDDYIIAYKGIRNDRYSNYNFQYQYLPNHIYESTCDCTRNENSFGLSAWTEESAREYCNQLVIKVKVKIEDIGRIVHNGGKLRCFKFEILN